MMVRAGAQINCECCESGGLILVDGNFDSGGGDEIAREWGAHLQVLCDEVGLGWQVVYYPDVAGVDFDINDYIGIHIILPITFVGSVAAYPSSGLWTPPNGAPRRVVIHGDANGDSPAPYDYGTTCKDQINTFFGLISGTLAIGSDAKDTGNWDADTTASPDLTDGIASSGTPILQQESSEVTGGTRLTYTASTDTGAHETIVSSGAGHDVSWVLLGTPSWLDGDTGSGIDPDNVQLVRNLHTVAV